MVSNDSHGDNNKNKLTIMTHVSYNHSHLNQHYKTYI